MCPRRRPSLVALAQKSLESTGAAGGRTYFSGSPLCRNDHASLAELGQALGNALGCIGQGAYLSHRLTAHRDDDRPSLRTRLMMAER